jgi:hypothetical protein
MSLIKYLFFSALLLLLLGGGLQAQLDLFQPHAPKSSDADRYEQKITPNKARYFEVTSPTELAKAINAAPAEGTNAQGKELLLTLPDPEGRKATFRITRYQMITDELQAVYPTYATAFGWDVDAPHRKIFLDWTGQGFGASITGGAEGRWYIEPLYHQQKKVYQSFFTHDYPRRDRDESCGFVPNPKLQAELAAFGHSDKSVGDCQLREYDLALACTGEYYAAVGGTEASVVTEMMRAINRVNEVFRSDLAIQLTIINLPTSSNGIQLLYNNPASDPYTNDSGSTMLNENQTNVDAVIGSANYDIGHVFSTGGGGIAQLDSPCVGGKARGVTGLPNPTGDPFYIDFVAHEIGHQFGGNHTFNSTENNCGTRNNSTAYEPGGGTTIQAYAGICGMAANIQPSSDPYYHAISIQEISTYMELGGGNACADIASTANTAPLISGGNDYTIPANTPFVLTATGSDGDGDALTYCWEQFDLGSVVAGEPTGNELTGPLFRSLPPTAATERYFPNLPSLVAGGGSPWENLPLQTRDLNFIVTLRDFGAAGYGCTVQDEVLVSVVNTGSQYAVTSPNGGNTWQSGNMETVTWDIGGTDVNGINCTMVDIVLSTDGGTNFDQVLATVANNGSASVTAPSTTETNARIMVRCNGNIFFDISNADFSIEQTDYDFQVVDVNATVCENATTADFSFSLESLQGYTGTINYSTTGLPMGVTAAFTPSSTTLSAGATQAVSFTLSGLGSLATGPYTFQVVTDDGNPTKSEDFFLEILPPFATPMLLTPVDNGFLPLNAAAFDWEDVDNATSYRINFYSDLAGTMSAGSLGSLATSGANFGNSFESGNSDGDMLFWKITALNANCDPEESSVSEIRKFTFGTMVSGNSLAAGGSPMEVCTGETADSDFTVSFFNGDLTGPATLSSTATPSGVSVVITPTTLNDGETATISLTGEESLTPGSYTVTIQADDGSTTETVDLTIEVIGDVNILTPINDADISIETNGGCNNDNVIYVDFEFDAYTGATVTDYTLYVSLPGGGFFTPGTVTPGTVNTRGYCANIDQEYNFRIEANLAGGGTVTSCTGNFFARFILPVNWLSFTAQPVGKTALLSWSVNQDLLNEGFTVERSSSSANNWEPIGYTASTRIAGNESYSFTDVNVRSSNTYLYRLWQQDSDGTISYSEIRTATFSGSNYGITAHPNPAGNFVILTTPENASETLNFTLTNALGQRISEGRFSSGQARIDLANLPTAVYQIVVSGNNNYREIIRVVKR